MVFLQNGADVNRLNDVGDTALHRAAYTGRVVSASKPLHSTLAPGHSAGADFTKGLKFRFRLKFETLVLNFVNRMLSLWS